MKQFTMADGVVVELIHDTYMETQSPYFALCVVSLPSDYDGYYEIGSEWDVTINVGNLARDEFVLKNDFVLYSEPMFAREVIMEIAETTQFHRLTPYGLNGMVPVFRVKQKYLCDAQKNNQM